MIMAHLKRYAMPKEWPLARKRETWVVRPAPGPHALKKCIPLQVILRDILGFAETANEAKGIVKAGKILVDKKPRKEPKFPVGLMDIVEIPESRKQFRVKAGKVGLELEKISGEETNLKLCMITGKSTIRGGLLQLNLHDGRNILAGKKCHYKCGDSILIELPDQKIIRHFSFEKGTPAFITAGRNMGAEGIIKKVNRRKNMLEKGTVVVESHGREIETLIKYVFPGTPAAVKKAPVEKKAVAKPAKKKPAKGGKK